MKRVLSMKRKKDSVKIQMVFLFNDEQFTTLIGAGNNKTDK